MRQVHHRTQLGERVRRPVPPVGGFQHHLRDLPGAGHHRRQPLHIVDDPHRLQPLTGLGHPHDHRPASMQNDPHELLAFILTHRGLHRRKDVSTPSMTRDVTRSGGPAPSSHQAGAARCAWRRACRNWYTAPTWRSTPRRHASSRNAATDQGSRPVSGSHTRANTSHWPHAVRLVPITRPITGPSTRSSGSATGFSDSNANVINNRCAIPRTSPQPRNSTTTVARLVRNSSAGPTTDRRSTGASNPAISPHPRPVSAPRPAPVASPPGTPTPTSPIGSSPARQASPSTSPSATPPARPTMSRGPNRARSCRAPPLVRSRTREGSKAPPPN